MSKNSIKGKGKLLAYSVSALVTIGFSVSGAQAAEVDFNIVAPTTGSIDYTNGNSALIGTDIDVDSVVGLDTPLNDSVLSICDVCTLNFSTGNFDSYDGTTWTFMGGGSIEIVGGVDFPDLPASGDVPTGTTLLTGSFNEARVIELPSGEFEFSIFGGSFIDTKDPDLLAYYGLPTEVDYNGGLNISFSAQTNGSGGFNSTSLFSGDIVNTPVPLPAAAWLLLGALGTLTFARRNKK
jgi:hypothetical protein